MNIKDARRLIKKQRYEGLNLDIQKKLGVSNGTVVNQLKVNSDMNSPMSIKIINAAFECIKEHNNKIIVPQ